MIYYFGFCFAFSFRPLPVIIFFHESFYNDSAFSLHLSASFPQSIRKTGSDIHSYFSLHEILLAVKHDMLFDFREITNRPENVLQQGHILPGMDKKSSYIIWYRF